LRAAIIEGANAKLDKFRNDLQITSLGILYATPDLIRNGDILLRLPGGQYTSVKPLLCVIDYEARP